MRIYICHKYGGDENNKQHIEQIIKALIKKDPTKVYISPVHLFGYLYNDLSYDDGIKLCLNELQTCDAMFTFGLYSQSKGCTLEKQYCLQHNILIIGLGDVDLE